MLPVPGGPGSTPVRELDPICHNWADPLLGLKENVIIGKLLPSGTGMKCYRNISLEKASQANEQAVVEEKPLLFDDYDDFDLDIASEENN